MEYLCCKCWSASTIDLNVDQWCPVCDAPICTKGTRSCAECNTDRSRKRYRMALVMNSEGGFYKPEDGDGKKRE